MLKRLFYLLSFLITAHSLAMESKISPGKQEEEVFKWSSLPRDIQAEILRFGVGLQNSQPKSVLESYKNFINLKRANKQLYRFLNQFDEKTKLNLYYKYLLDNLTEQDFTELNEYLFENLQDSYLLLDLLKKLKRFDLNAINRHGSTLLITAIKKKRYDLAKFLINSGADVNAMDRGQNTALMWASSLGNEELVKLLIAKGVDVNAAGEQEKTALRLVNRSKYPGVAKLLIEAGATR